MFFFFPPSANLKVACVHLHFQYIKKRASDLQTEHTHAHKHRDTCFVVFFVICTACALIACPIHYSLCMKQCLWPTLPTKVRAAFTGGIVSHYWLKAHPALSQSIISPKSHIFRITHLYFPTKHVEWFGIDMTAIGFDFQLVSELRQSVAVTMDQEVCLEGRWEYSSRS